MKVPATKPCFSEEDIAFITERFKGILRGESFLSMGKYGEELEAAFARYVGTKHAVACNSGTAALELICRALDVSGREVILPSNTFVATANAIMNAGGVPVFADCGDDMCLDPADVERRITSRTAAVMLVHIGGLVSRSVVRLEELCRARGIHLLEDAAQAHGSSFGGRRAGAIGVAAGFSFFSTKVMTTGEGGMVTTDDGAMAEKMRSMREFGKVKSDIYVNCYAMLGYNWRMPEVAALMGLTQLRALPAMLERRAEVGRLYDELLAGVRGIDVISADDKREQNYFKYIVILREHDRPTIHRALASRGVQLSGYVYELPLHKQPIFPEANALHLPTTERVCATHICLPVFPGITDEQVRHVATSLREVLEAHADPSAAR
jgi:dTDP-4-amino-4,6-dideoxygalactose transaminase